MTRNTESDRGVAPIRTATPPTRTARPSPASSPVPSPGTGGWVRVAVRGLALVLGGLLPLLPLPSPSSAAPTDCAARGQAAPASTASVGSVASVAQVARTGVDRARPARAGAARAETVRPAQAGRPTAARAGRAHAQAAADVRIELPRRLPAGLRTPWRIELRNDGASFAATLVLDFTAEDGGYVDGLELERYDPDAAEHDTRGWLPVTINETGRASMPVQVPAGSSSRRLRLLTLNPGGRYRVGVRLLADHESAGTGQAATDAVAPAVALVGLPRSFGRGGTPGEFSARLTNGTGTGYRGLSASVAVWGSDAPLGTDDVRLEQSRPGHGWRKVELTAGCDPSLGGLLATGLWLPDGGARALRLRLAVQPDAPPGARVLHLSVGVSTSEGNEVASIITTRPIEPRPLER